MEIIYHGLKILRPDFPQSEDFSWNVTFQLPIEFGKYPPNGDFNFIWQDKNVNIEITEV